MHKDAANDSASASRSLRWVVCFFFFITQNAPRSQLVPAVVALLNRGLKIKHLLVGFPQCKYSKKERG